MARKAGALSGDKVAMLMLLGKEREVEKAWEDELISAGAQRQALITLEDTPHYDKLIKMGFKRSQNVYQKVEINIGDQVEQTLSSRGMVVVPMSPYNLDIETDDEGKSLTKVNVKYEKNRVTITW